MVGARSAVINATVLAYNNKYQQNHRSGQVHLSLPIQSRLNENQQHGWQARLQLTFSRQKLRSVLSQRQHVGPLRVQRPFYPEGPQVCHVILLHPPGGIVGGDRLDSQVTVQTGSHALLTTPAATKFYASSHKQAVQQQTLTVAKQAVLEWLPMETIVFNNAHAVTKTRVDLAAQSQFIGWDIVCLGRPAAEETFSEGCYQQQFEIYRAGLPLKIERAIYQGGAPLLNQGWGLAGHSVVGTLLASGADQSLLDMIRCSTARCDGHVPTASSISTTLIDDVLIVRVLGQQTQLVLQQLIQIWQLIRPVLLGKEACLPRIWAT